MATLFRSAQVEALRRQLRGAPQDPALRNQQGDLLLAEGQTGRAAKAFRRSAELYLAQAQYARAIAVLRKAFREVPGDHATADLLVQACRLGGRPQLAAETYFALSQLQTERGDDLAAFQLFSRGVAENPGGVMKKRRLVTWAKQLGKRDKAADLLLELAEFMGQRMDLDRAFRFIGEARELRNGPKVALVEARLLLQSGQPGNASLVVQQARRRFPNHAGLQTLEATLTSRGSEAGAWSHVAPPAQLARLRHNLQQAQAWQEKGYATRALSLVQRMLLVDPGYLPALALGEEIHAASGYLSRFQHLCISCAQRLAQQSRLPEAEACLDRAENLFPGSTVAYRHILRGGA